MLTSQGEYPFPMLPVTREDTAAKFPLWGNSQMFARPVLPSLSTGGALGLATTVAKLAQLLQLRSALLLV